MSALGDQSRSAIAPTIDLFPCQDYRAPTLMFLARKILALCILVSLCPGLAETMHDGLHQMLEIEEDQASAAECCPEHGCTPLAHQCSCCVSIPAVPSTSVSLLASIQRHAYLGTWTPRADQLGAVGFKSTLERPPRA